MTPEEYKRQQEEAERLRNQINHLINQINATQMENAMLEQELRTAIQNVSILIRNAGHMDNNVNREFEHLSKVVGNAEISTAHVFNAIKELAAQYFIYKNISTASKNITQFTDEYNTRFKYYNHLRRITLGFVVGLDSYIVSSESMRKSVEKAYLQNTEYWVAYCIAAVMLWASGEKEAAERAISKSLSINYFNSCLFYLLINLRFNRIEAAKKWYANYLDRIDTLNLGDEWRYLLQAYLSGIFGQDKEFQKVIAKRFINMFAQIEVSTVDFGKNFSERALNFAEVFLHKTEHEYPILKKTCTEYEEMKDLLSQAEKNAVIAKYYNTLAEAEAEEGDLAQRIENVLYSLINNYDDDELSVVKKIKYNEAVVGARGDVAAAQANYNLMFKDEKKKKSLADLLLTWAFSEDPSQTDIVVKKFSISFMKDAIARGFEKFIDNYRKNEKEKYSFTVEGCKLSGDENDFVRLRPELEKYFDQNKMKDTLKDKFVLIYIALCGASLLTFVILVFAFSKVALTFGILVGVTAGFLLWRRIVDLGKILKEKKRKGVQLLKNALEELRQWRLDYKSEDSRGPDLIDAVKKF